MVPFRLGFSSFFFVGADTGAFCLMLYTTKHVPDKRNFQLILFVLESDTNRTNWDFPFIWPVGLLFPPGSRRDFVWWFRAILVGQNWKRIFEKTGVGFGRTELSLRAIGTTVHPLSFGHDPSGLGFQGGEDGVDF